MENILAETNSTPYLVNPSFLVTKPFRFGIHESKYGITNFIIHGYIYYIQLRID